MEELNLPLAAASSAAAALGDLIQIAHEGAIGCRSLDEDTIPQLADALKMTIEHAVVSGEHDASDVEGAELLARLKDALGAFLEGWA